MFQGSSGSSYRLVVHFDDRQLIFGASPFSSYKQALRQVSTAVRRHARDGAIARVCLQRGVPLGGAAAVTQRVSHWVAVEQWNGDVVGRILAQTGGLVATVPQRIAAAPAVLPTRTTAPASAFRPAVGGIDRKSHRWHVGLTLAVAVVAWLAIAVVLADGRLGNLLGITATSRPAEATELPFEAPSLAEAHRPEASPKTPSLHAVHQPLEQGR